MSQEIPFFKYHGAGNDFILIDYRNHLFDVLDEQTIALKCTRRFGIGADGLILLKNSDVYDFEMQYFNADGRVGSMCGNGGRCIVAFARDLQIIQDKAVFLAVDGIHEAYIDDNSVALKMRDVEKISKIENDYVLNTGSPHLVRFVNQLQDLDVRNSGQQIRWNDVYREKGININFVEIINDKIYIRTYERGVEDETYACGTGAVAAAVTLAYKEQLKGNVERVLTTKGGELTVRFKINTAQLFTDIWLIGRAQFVFKGVLKI